MCEGKCFDFSESDPPDKVGRICPPGVQLLFPSLHCDVVWCDVLSCGVLCCVVLCCVVLCCVVLCCVVLCCVVLCCVVPLQFYCCQLLISNGIVDIPYAMFKLLWHAYGFISINLLTVSFLYLWLPFIVCSFSCCFEGVLTHPFGQNSRGGSQRAT